MLAFKEVSRNSIRQKNLTVEISDFGGWGLTPKLSPQFPDAMGGLIALVELIATRYYSTP